MKLSKMCVSVDGEAEVVLTAPLSFEAENESDSNYKAPHILKRILSLFASIRPGSDLTHIQLPPSFNLPKSQLQCYGESIYSVGFDMLGKCSNEETPLGRFVSVVSWSISTLRPLAFGVVPYNPILGETHHVSTRTLNVLLEQVAHHPPVTALHATDEKAGIELICCHHAVPKFYGAYIDTEVHGRRELKLHSRNETYTMNSPNLVIRLLPVPRVDWDGNVVIKCKETGLEAELRYRGNTFLPRPSVHRSVKGRIFRSSTSETICEINGHWDKTVKMTDVSTRKTTIIYDAAKAISKLKTPVLKDPKAVLPSESTVVWAEVSKAILQKRWEDAREAKTQIEERQRQSARARKMRNEKWKPKFFNLSHSDDNRIGWECSPIHPLVSPAPIIIDD